MIFKVISVILGVIIIGGIVNVIVSKIGKYNSILSFKESMDLTELPIITMYSGNKKLNFLLDTGSNNSVINSSELINITYAPVNAVIDTVGLNGTVEQSPICEIDLYYKKNKFLEEFVVIDMNESFASIKKENGVILHGILGSKFLEKYKYVLDFKELIAYIKK